jgi:hypothetical protein
MSALDLVDIGQKGFQGNKTVRRKGEASSVVFPTNHGTFPATSVQWKSFDFLRVALQICGTDLPAEKKMIRHSVCILLKRSRDSAVGIATGYGLDD